MASKRKHPQDGDTLYNKRSRISNLDGSDDTPQSRVDPTYGQRGAFPGLDNDKNEDEALFYGPAGDGLEYLRMVR